MERGEVGLSVCGVLSLCAGILCELSGAGVWSIVPMIAGIVFVVLAEGLSLRNRKRIKAAHAAAEEALAKEVALAKAQVEESRRAQMEQMRQWQSNVTHSLRMPFSVILGYADLLQGDIVTDEEVKKEYLGKIRDRVAYLNDVVSQLLMETRVASSVSACMPEPVELVSLAKGILKDMEAVAGKKGIVLQLVTGEAEVELEADVTQLQKLFYNILENALKYMKRAGTVTVVVSKVEEEVLLVFKDDGEGLREEETEHIFDLNYQGSNRTNGGGGLGLHLVRNIVLAHGGRIKAHSSEGQGMGIYINLPLIPPVKKEMGENLNES